MEACSDDDANFSAVDNGIPSITLTSERIQTEPGREFTIGGTISDADGLKSIRLRNSGMFLDKTIDLLKIYPDTLLHDYTLSYNYTAADDWTDEDEFPVEITVEDVVGNTSSASVTVTPDGDFTAPQFTQAPSGSITVLMQNPQLTVNCAVSDNKSIKYVKLSIPGLSIDDSVAVNNLREYSHTWNYTLPATEAEYEMVLSAGDNFNNTVTDTCTITVSEMPDFSKMYLADVSTASALTSDLFGVPMLIEHTGAYQYRARYYNQKSGTEIRFIPQKTDFTPICFGKDPQNESVLTSDPSLAEPIVLDEVAYYEINFNSVSGEYSVSTYTPNDEPFPQGEMFTENGIEQAYELSLAGAGLPGVGSWSTSDPLLLTQDANNPYLFYAEMSLTSGTEIEFTITPKSASGWWPEPYWRFESGDGDSKENEYNTKNGGNNMTKVTVTTSGNYRFEFDTHLLRSRLYLIN